VISVLAKCYGWSFVTAGVMKLIQELLAFVSPEILKCVELLEINLIVFKS